MKPQVIALVGNAGAGKSTVADYLIAEHGYHRVKFAGPLKNMLRAIGLDDEEIEGSRKEQPCELLCGKTPRHAMVTLGTEWGRDLIGPEFWTGLWEEEVCAHLNSGLSVVVDDCRFPNELEAVKRRRGEAWHIVRPAHGGSSLPGHRSEGALSEFYADMRTVANTGWIEDLHSKVRQIMELAEAL
ncbi:deoxynucleotide monophosphate kinase family protein [Paraburkholderia atlantica]|uniref:deoxynucleotide monophosphate kinase family protein n=1 Tax=Paraburkholderia atlantica TaxID=2654982 RepID=UPI00160F621C|nr:deoxynucleotide monophosphate kinase [Paraburkholderia atlantica]MBB5414081.1 hypothetical protein [Paraburkholderia atlantica]